MCILLLLWLRLSYSVLFAALPFCEWTTYHENDYDTHDVYYLDVLLIYRVVQKEQRGSNGECVTKEMKDSVRGLEWASTLCLPSLIY